MWNVASLNNDFINFNCYLYENTRRGIYLHVMCSITVKEKLLVIEWFSILYVVSANPQHNCSE